MSMPFAISYFCCLMTVGNTAPSEGGLNTTMVIGTGPAARALPPVVTNAARTATVAIANFFMSPSRPPCALFVKPHRRYKPALRYKSALQVLGMVLDKGAPFKPQTIESRPIGG